MSLTIEIRENTVGPRLGMVTVTLGGSLDSLTAPELEQALAPVLAGAVMDLVFDLTALRFLSSAGIRVFTVARKSLTNRGGMAMFYNPQPQIREVFEIIQALPGVMIFRDDAELDAYLAIRQMRHSPPKPE